ncbi:CD225/dispanin family protein [Hugenholtzia roseola]|uniref:CD225/dispanin family protein n=1 Tax=Hugenholtzia roseola TaxID=1002 RepID=UPI000558E996|nr:CD225/dispanin family protein [Hugenholtzia roseola]
MPPKPDNNLVWAIVCTVACCLPLGIVAIIESTKVDKLYAQGDYSGAEQAAANAKKYSIWGAAGAGIIMVLYIIFMVVMGGAAVMSGGGM